jgi:pyrroloquinoline quinone biosynthesis protein B
MCTGVRAGTIRTRARTQSSIAASGGDGNWLLVNASPDILQQLRSFEELQPQRALRDTAIAAILLMDAQIDHCTGLYMLREHRARHRLWCTRLVREDLSEANPVLRILEHYCGIEWNEIEPDGVPFTIDPVPGLMFEAQTLSSNAPPYSSRRDKPLPGDNIGVTIIDAASGARLFYAPGIGAIDDALWSQMERADCVLVDGTVWTDDEMIRLGISGKSGRAMGHLAQSGPGGMIEWLDRLPAQVRRVLIHINNTNPILDEDSPERELLTRHHIEIAYDGMEIQL